MVLMNGVGTKLAVRFRFCRCRKVSVGRSRSTRGTPICEGVVLMPHPAKRLPATGVAVMVLLLPSSRKELGANPGVTEPFPEMNTCSGYSSFTVRETRGDACAGTPSCVCTWTSMLGIGEPVEKEADH